MTSPGTRPLRDIVAANLDRAITASGRTNRSVAEQVGTTEHQVWRWRKGKVGPSDVNLVALAEALGLDVSWFFVERHDSNGEPEAVVA